MDKIEQARQVLRDAGYYVDNLWCTEDVQNICKCSEQEAQNVLHQVLNTEHVTDEINFSIRMEIDRRGFELIEEE